MKDLRNPLGYTTIYSFSLRALFFVFINLQLYNHYRVITKGVLKPRVPTLRRSRPPIPQTFFFSQSQLKTPVEIYNLISSRESNRILLSPHANFTEIGSSLKKRLKFINLETPSNSIYNDIATRCCSR